MLAEVSRTITRRWLPPPGMAGRASARAASSATSSCSASSRSQRGRRGWVGLIASLVVGQLRLDRDVDRGHVEAAGQVAQGVAARVEAGIGAVRSARIAFGAWHPDGGRRAAYEPGLLRLLAGDIRV